MWWAGFRAVTHVYVGTRRVAWIAASGQSGSAAVQGITQALDVLAQAWPASRGWPLRRVRVWFSGGLCRPFLLPQPAELASDAELVSLAAALAPARTALAGPCKVWLEGQRIGAPTVKRLILRACAAIQESTWQQTNDLALRAGWKLISARPWWSEALRAGLLADEASAIAVHDCDSLTALMGGDGEFETATTYAPIADEDAAEAAWRRLTGLALEMQLQLHVVVL